MLSSPNEINKVKVVNNNNYIGKKKIEKNRIKKKKKRNEREYFNFVLFKHQFDNDQLVVDVSRR